MIFFSVYTVVFVLLRPWPNECFTTLRVLNSVAFVALSGLSLVAHVQTMVTNPGAVPQDAVPVSTSDAKGPADGVEQGAEGEDQETTRLADRAESEGNSLAPAPKRWPFSPLPAGSTPQEKHTFFVTPSSSLLRGTCREGTSRWCDAFKPQRAHHCSVCGRCIVKMDHHCPWVNNCVGIGNQKLFVLFCTYTCILCLYALLLLFMEVVLPARQGRGRSSPHESDRDTTCLFHPDDQLAATALASIALLFGLFTACMACDQCSLVGSQQTKIDRLKGEFHETSLDVNEVFGGTGAGCRLHWALPVPMVIPPGKVGALMMGYETGHPGAGRDRLHWEGGQPDLEGEGGAAGGEKHHFCTF
ncbi:unnamed protein product [Discosporangium mesarthrocarpum]